MSDPSTPTADAASPLTVLVVDDDDDVRSVVSEHLATRGIVTVEAAEGETALKRVEEQPPDVVVLDVSMPGRTGLDVLRVLRARPDGGPSVILLTAAGEEVDRVLGLEMGADDYVTKPFSLRELEARIKAVTRRQPKAPAPNTAILTVDDISIDRKAREVRRSGEPVELTPREFDLLVYLVEHPRHAFTRDELLRAVWGSSASWQVPSTVTEHVRRLRLKLEADPARPRLLVTVRGSGYRLDPISD